MVDQERSATCQGFKKVFLRTEYLLYPLGLAVSNLVSFGLRKEPPPQCITAAFT